MAFLTLVAFCVYFYWAISHTEEMILQEKLTDLRFGADVVCDQIDHLATYNKDWGVYDYPALLARAVEKVDASEDTYAELFNADLDSISERTPFYEGAPFVPAEYPALISAMAVGERGEMTVWFDKPGVIPQDTHLYYRWVPSDTTAEDRLLVLVGASKYSIDNSFSAWITYGAIALILVTAVLITSAVVLLCRLGYIYEQRGGADKWKAGRFS